MALFKSNPNDLEKALPAVFTPASPISTRERLKGRDRLLEDLSHAYRRQGASIVLYGERGVGKTSIAKVAQQILPGEHLYYSAGADDSFISIASSVLTQLDAQWDAKSRERGEKTKTNVKAGISVASGSLDHERQTTFIHQPLGELRLTSQEITNRLPRTEGLIIIDDFERIEDDATRAQFADLVKKLSDNQVPSTLVIVGIAGNIQELLRAHESAQRSLVEVKVPRLSQAEIGTIVVDGLQKLDIDIDSDCTEQISEFSAQFPYYTHLLCEGAVTTLISALRSQLASDYRITQREIDGAIRYAIRNTEYSISHAYEEATRSITDSPRFKYTLYALASWPGEPVPYREICRWVGQIIRAPSGEVNVSHQLKRLEDSGVIEKTGQGFYRFSNPILKAYVILKFRSDTPGVEMAAIDTQIKHVQKRLDRVSQRL